MAAFNRVQPFNLGVNIMKIGEYFDDYEFSCNCERHDVDENGHNVLDHIIDKRLVDLLDAIRERLGVPVTIAALLIMKRLAVCLILIIRKAWRLILPMTA